MNRYSTALTNYFWSAFYSLRKMNFISPIVILLALCTLVASDRERRPNDTKNKFSDSWYEAVYLNGYNNTGAASICSDAIISINREDDITITTARTDVDSNEKQTLEFVAGRVDDGSSTKYKWLSQNPGTGANETFTLLAVTETFAAFLFEKADVKPILYVFTREKTLSDDVKKEINKIDQAKDIVLTPDQNTNCKV